MATSTATQQQQLESLQAKAAEGARLLAESRAAAKEGQQALQEQQRLCKQQAATLEEMKQELAAARKAAVTAGERFSILYELFVDGFNHLSCILRGNNASVYVSLSCECIDQGIDVLLLPQADFQDCSSCWITGALMTAYRYHLSVIACITSVAVSCLWALDVVWSRQVLRIREWQGCLGDCRKT